MRYGFSFTGRIICAKICNSTHLGCRRVAFSHLIDEMHCSCASYSTVRRTDVNRSECPQRVYSGLPSQLRRLERRPCFVFLRHGLMLWRPARISDHRCYQGHTRNVAVAILLPQETSDDLNLASHQASSSSKLRVDLLSLSDIELPVGKQDQYRSLIQWKQWTYERQEAREVVVQFLRKLGLSVPVAVEIVSKAPSFITHLVTVLQSSYHEVYESGKEPTTTEIRQTLLKYLESCGGGNREDLISIVASFDNEPSFSIEEPWRSLSNLSSYPCLLEHSVDGNLPLTLIYFLSIGLTPSQLEDIVKRCPPIASWSFEGKVMLVVEYLLGIGVPASCIPRIVRRRPQLFGCSVELSLKPTVAFLEEVGVQRDRWARILVSFPHMLTYSNVKVTLVIEFLLQVGLSPSGAGKVLTRFPHIVGYSIEGKLKPIAAYFSSIGIENVSHFIMRSPQIFGLSLEKNIKPTVEFFLSLGFSMDDMARLLGRFPQVLGLNVEHNLQAKWNYFVSMDRCKSELVNFPQFFGYSLEKRIQPRNEVLLQRRLSWTLNRMLSSSEKVFLQGLR